MTKPFFFPIVKSKQDEITYNEDGFDHDLRALDENGNDLFALVTGGDGHVEIGSPTASGGLLEVDEDSSGDSIKADGDITGDEFHGTRFESLQKEPTTQDVTGNLSATDLDSRSAVYVCNPSGGTITLTFPRMDESRLAQICIIANRSSSDRVDLTGATFLSQKVTSGTLRLDPERACYLVRILNGGSGADDTWIDVGGA